MVVSFQYSGHKFYQTKTTLEQTKLKKINSLIKNQRRIIKKLYKQKIFCCAQNGQQSEVKQAQEFLVELDVVALRGSVPAQWVEDIRKILAKSGKITVNERTNYMDIYKELQKEDSRAFGADLVSMGDQWLQIAKQNKLITPFAQNLVNDVSNSVVNYPLWNKIMRLDGEAVWGIPYRWGCMFLAVNSQRTSKILGGPLHDWGDLLNPKFKQKLVLPTSPQMLLEVAAKTLNLGFNPSVKILQQNKKQLQDRVKQLIDQTLLVSDRDGVRSILCGDAWIVLGSSDDLITVADRGKQIELVAPNSGTLLWCDFWCLPYGVQSPNPLTSTWINFGLQPDRVTQRKGIRRGGSPLILTEIFPMEDQNFDDGYLKRNLGYLPSKSVLEQSDFLLPLTQERQELYSEIFRI